MLRRVRQFHHNTRGALSVLVLLTIWCLVALIGMVWNTAEYAVQRQRLQNAVDSTAYAASVWRARTYNQVTAQNMLIAQDASAEIVFSASKDTDGAITNELNTEFTLLKNFEGQQKLLRSRLPGLMINIDNQYTLVTSALALVQDEISSGNMTFPDPQAATVYKNKVRQAAYALNWLQNTYVFQLDAIARKVQDVTLTDKMIADALAILGDTDTRAPGTEFGELQAFEDQINGAPADSAALLQDHEQDLFDDEQNLTTQFWTTARKQSENLADFYGAKSSAWAGAIFPDDSSDEGEILKQADEVPTPDTWTDQIRADHPEFNREPQVTLDPININTQEDGDSDIIYTYYIVIINGKPVKINCDAPGGHGWGHCSVFPLERYLSSRVAEDAVGLRSFMSPIDALRQQIAQEWAQDLGISLNVPPLPGSIPDPQPDPITHAATTIPLLPNLTATTAAGDKTDSDFAYRRASSAYLTAIRQLVNALNQYEGLLDRFTAPYAVPTWYGKLAAERYKVALRLGETKAFMVLPTYNLYQIPNWARGQMRSSLIDAISWQIYRDNPVLWQLGPEGAFAQIETPASEIAAEMVARPWPYEKAPPLNPVPPAAGITKQDRGLYSAFAIIDSSRAVGVRTLFPSIFGANQSVTAYAQSEAFNWMEYNDNYGGYYTEKFDEVSLNTFGSLLACPRAWRLSTIGGWNWQARLSVADGLSGYANPQVSPNSAPDVQEFLGTAGVTNTDEPSLSHINLH